MLLMATGCSKTDNGNDDSLNISDAIQIVDLSKISDIKGQVLSGTIITAGIISDKNGINDVTYQWKSSPTVYGNYENIDNATNINFSITENEIGRYLKVIATYTDDNGKIKTLTSNSMGPIVAASIGAIAKIKGAALITIRVTAGIITDVNGYNNVTYQWKSSSTVDGNYENIDNATNVNFTISEDQRDRYLKVVGTYTDDYRQIKTVTSNSIGPIKSSIEATNFTPSNNAEGVTATDEITISFEDNILKDENKSISIYTDDNSILALENISLKEVIIVDNVAKIVYNNHLKYGAIHYIKIDSSSFSDINDNRYPGIDDTTTWSFSVAQGPCGCNQLDNCDLDERLQN
jgi:hypothetical protein